MLSNQDTINGVTIKQWLNEHEPALEIKPEQVSDRHYIKRKPKVRYKVKSEKAGKVRRLTRNEIIKEYGQMPMSNIERVIEKMREWEIGRHYSFQDIVKQMKGQVTEKSLSALVSTIYMALKGKDILERTGKPYHYFTGLGFRDIDNVLLLREIKDRTNKKQMERKKKKKTEIHVTKTAIPESTEDLQKQLMDQAEVSIPLNQLSGLIRSIIQKEVSGKLKVQIDIRFGFIS